MKHLSKEIFHKSSSGHKKSPKKEKCWKHRDLSRIFIHSLFTCFDFPRIFWLTRGTTVLHQRGLLSNTLIMFSHICYFPFLCFSLFEVLLDKLCSNFQVTPIENAANFNQALCKMFLLLFISQPMGSIKWEECRKADCNVTTENTNN